jgi:hypothetical protein
MKNISLLKQEKGSTVIVFLFIMSMLAALAVGALQVTSLNVESSRGLLKGKQSYYAAEVGMDTASDTVIQSFQNLVPFQSTNGFVAIPNYRGYNVSYNVTQTQPRFLYQTVNGQDILNHWAYTYNVVSTATSLTDNSTETLRESIRILETPLVQWFIFYGGNNNNGSADLEIHSGSNWTSWGRVHTNGNFYVGSTQNAFHRFQNFDPNGIQTPHAITVAGNILNQTKASSFLVNGNQVGGFSVNNDADVKTTNAAPIWQNSQAINAVINPGSKTVQEARFNGFVIAQQQLQPTPGPVVIQRTGFYEAQSLNPQLPGVDGITILGQGGFVPGGFQVTVARPVPTDVTNLIRDRQTSPGVPYIGPPFIIRERVNDFCDGREQRRVDTTDIDLNALTLWYQQYLADPVNGGGALGAAGFMIYASRSPNAAFTNLAGNMQSVRLRGGLGGGAPVPQILGNTTFATDNPLYIQGDFNTINRKGVAIIADAINVLSRGWNNTKNCGGGTPGTNTPTSVNAAFFTGNSVSQPGGAFEGGAINYPRFHEWWQNVPFTYRGAFVNLWVSAQANGNWCLGADCYSAPIRNWGWETNFQNPNFWPPFMPSVYAMEREGFIE